MGFNAILFPYSNVNFTFNKSADLFKGEQRVGPTHLFICGCLRHVNFSQGIMNWKQELPTWCNISHSKPRLLRLDQACLTITNLEGEGSLIDIFAQSVECEKCTLWSLGKLAAGKSANIVTNTTYTTKLAFRQTDKTLCEFSHKFEEYGLYSLNVSSEYCSGIITNTEPANIYLPLLWTALACIGGLLLWGLLCVCREQDLMKKVRTVFHNTIGSTGEVSENLLRSDSVDPTRSNSSSPSSTRIRALDTIRGFAITLMILVNYGGGKYWFLSHAPWNGLTVADIVFPWFVWIMGFSAMLSLHGQLRRVIPRRRVLMKIVRRTLLLFTIGLVLNTTGNNNVNTLRIPGVLQRLSFVYFAVSLIELLCHDPEDNHRYAWYAPFRDVVCAWRQWIVMISLLLLHLLLTFLLPVPGCPVGYLGPGGLHNSGLHSNCTGGAAGFLDKLIFGPQHIYQYPTPRLIYSTTEPFDPEGLLGSLTCVLSAYLGVQAGKILLLYSTNRQRIVRWMLWAIFAGLVGGGLCEFSQNSGPIPINKNLWSLSFLLVTGSSAFAAMTLFYYLIDVLRLWSGAPLRYAGMNALLLYVGHVLAKPLFPFSWSPVSSTHGAHLAMNLCATLIWNLIAWVLYKQRIFLSL